MPPLPQPESGLVIRYSYLWAYEARRGQEEGLKDRPCAVVLSVKNEAGAIRVLVAPITHSQPESSSFAIEMPPAVKARLRLDTDQSWIITDEVNPHFPYEI